MSIRVLVVDDHKIIRDGLRSLIEKEPTLELVGEADNGRTAVRMAEELEPSVIIMDVSMKDLNGVEATRQIISSNPDVKVIALSMHADKRYVSRMLGAGSSGYLLKDCAFKELTDAINSVLANKTYLSPGIMGVVVEDYVRHITRKDDTSQSALSSREMEVLQLLAEGLSTKEIGRKLHISAKTVETHRRHLMEKLNLYSVAELTKYALREGLTTL